jgi:hypothetical protein
VQKSFVLTEREKVGILVVEAARSLVALLSELLVLKLCAEQRAGDVAREADLALGPGLAVDLVTRVVGADTTVRDHGQSHEHVPSLAQDSLVALLLLPLSELLPGTLSKIAARTTKRSSSRTTLLLAAHVPDVVEEASTLSHLGIWAMVRPGVKARLEIQSIATGVSHRLA